MKIGASKVECPICEATVTVTMSATLQSSGDQAEALVSIERMSGCPHADAWRPRPPDGGEPMREVA